MWIDYRASLSKSKIIYQHSTKLARPSMGIQVWWMTIGLPNLFIYLHIVRTCIILTSKYFILLPALIIYISSMFWYHQRFWLEKRMCLKNYFLGFCCMNLLGEKCNTYYVSGTGLCSGNIAVNKKSKGCTCTHGICISKGEGR